MAAENPLVYEIEYQDIPHPDFVTPRHMVRGTIVAVLLLVLFSFFGCSAVASEEGWGMWGGLVGAMIGAVIYAGMSLVGLEDFIMRRRSDGITRRNAKRLITFYADGSTDLQNLWAQPPTTAHFNADQVRSVEATRLVEFDHELSTRTTHNISIYSGRQNFRQRREHDRLLAIAAEWVVYLTLADGRTINVLHRPDREGAQRCVADVQEMLREAKRRRGHVAQFHANTARAETLAADDDAPL